MFTHDELLEEMPKLEKFAYKLTKTQDEAHDLLQSALLRCLEKKHLFKTGTNLFSWSSKVMYNLFVSKYRRKVKYSTQYDPENYIEKRKRSVRQEQKAELNRVNEAMEELSDKHKTVLVMVCVKGMKYKEVAADLDIPVGTVRSRLFRAREKLQHILEDEDILMDVQDRVEQDMPFHVAA